MTKQPDLTLVLVLQRGRRTRPFLIADPGLRRTVSLRRRVADLRIRKTSYELLLDQLPYGVIHLDARGQVTEVSSVARQMLARCTCVRISKRRFEAANREENQRLERAIRFALRGP